MNLQPQHTQSLRRREPVIAMPPSLPTPPHRDLLPSSGESATCAGIAGAIGVPAALLAHKIGAAPDEVLAAFSAFFVGVSAVGFVGRYIRRNFLPGKHQERDAP